MEHLFQIERSWERTWLRGTPLSPHKESEDITDCSNMVNRAMTPALVINHYSTDVLKGSN
jgi:hypothetical protein